MRSLHKLVLIALVSLFVFNSCTVDKRLHSGGYHIHWKHNKTTSQDKLLAKQETPVALPIENEEIAILEQCTFENDTPVKTSALPAEEERPEIRTSATVKVIQDIKSGLAVFSLQRNQAAAPAVPAVPAAPSSSNRFVRDPFGIASFIASILGYYMFSLTNNGAVFILMAIVLAIISINNIRNNPDKYYGIGWAIAGLSVALIGSIFAILYFVSEQSY